MHVLLSLLAEVLLSNRRGNDYLETFLHCHSMQLGYGVNGFFRLMELHTLQAPTLRFR